MVEAHPTYLLLPANCGRRLQAGTVIMNNAAVNNNVRSVVVTRNGVIVPDGSSFTPGEILVASLSSTTGVEYIIEVRGGAVVTGANTGCSNTRMALSSATFIVPEAQTTDITIVAAWTTANPVPVTVTNIFTLTAPHPTLSPTTAPSYSPGSSGAPTHEAHPTPPPTSYSGGTTGDDDYYADDTENSGFPALPDVIKGGIGAVIGAMGFAGIAYIVYRVAYNRVHYPDPRHISEKLVRFSRVTSVLAILTAMAASIMVSKWATPGTETDPLYLNKPDWQDNMFAYHPLLMVAGLFFTQVNAVTTWSIFTNHTLAKTIHVTWHISGIVLMFLGFHAVYKDKMKRQELHYTTLHSWIGGGSIAFVCFSFTWGSTMALLTKFWPNSIFRRAFDLRSAHKNIGILAFIGTTIAIVTGVMDQMPHGYCDPVLNNPRYVTDSARFYPVLKESCRLAHGLGIIVIISAALTLVTVAYRGDSYGRTREENDISITSKDLRVGRHSPSEESIRRLKARLYSHKGKGKEERDPWYGQTPEPDNSAAAGTSSITSMNAGITANGSNASLSEIGRADVYRSSSRSGSANRDERSIRSVKVTSNNSVPENSSVDALDYVNDTQNRTREFSVPILKNSTRIVPIEDFPSPTGSNYSLVIASHHVSPPPSRAVNGKERAPIEPWGEESML